MRRKKIRGELRKQRAGYELFGTGSIAGAVHRGSSKRGKARNKKGLEGIRLPAPQHWR
jgi:hypothetical protein